MVQAYNLQHFKYVALNKQLEEIQDISGYVVDGGSISYNSLSTLKTSCTIPIIINSKQKLSLDAIRIYEVLNGYEICLGTFLISTPSSDFDNTIQTINCTGYSTLWRISNYAPDNKYYVPKGTNVIGEVKRILEKIGYFFTIEESEKTTSVDREWDYGTPYLTIINELLESINYTSLYVDVKGNYIATPYTLPSDSSIDIVLDEEDINNVLEPIQTSELDLFNIPNKFIRSCSTSPEMELYAVYENKIGITGTENTWVNTNYEEVKDVADYDTLYALCKKACSEALSVYNKVQINTCIIPIPTYMATVQLKHYQAEGLYTCTSYDIELKTGGSQKMNLRKVIEIL